MFRDKMIVVRIADGASFGRTLRFIKDDRRSTYVPADRVWLIPADHRILGDGVNRREYRFDELRTIEPVA